MHSKSDINHFFFDGYEIQNDKLDNIEIISKLLDDINSLYINGKGQCIIIPFSFKTYIFISHIKFIACFF